MPLRGHQRIWAHLGAICAFGRIRAHSAQLGAIGAFGRILRIRRIWAQSAHLGVVGRIWAHSAQLGAFGRIWAHSVGWLRSHLGLQAYFAGILATPITLILK